VADGLCHAGLQRALVPPNKAPAAGCTAALLHPHQEFCMIVPNGFKVMSQKFSIIAPSKLPFAAVHESEVGTPRTFDDVRFRAAVRGIADIKRASAQHPIL